MMQLKNYFSKKYFSYGIILAIILRLICYFFSPCFSSDFIRFVWDGKLFSHSINPFIYLPSYLINNGKSVIAGVDYNFFSTLNFPNNYSPYGPFLQYIFAFAEKIVGANNFEKIFFFRLIISVTEIGIVVFMLKILKHFKRSETLVFWYLLNPLIIFELYVNVHIEIIAVFFLMASIYFFITQKNNFSALFLALASACNLIYIIPLFFLLPRLNFKKIITYLAFYFVFLALVFFPFLADGKLLHLLFTNATGFFETPEFYSPFYNGIHWFQSLFLTNFPEYKTGLLLFEIGTLAFIFFAFNQSVKGEITWLKNIFFGFIICLIFSAAVRPADFILLIALSVFISYRFIFIGSLFALLTYVSYLYYPVYDNLILLIVGYASLIALFFYEWKKGVM